MDKIIKLCGLIFIVFAILFSGRFFIGPDTIWFNIIFVSISLILIGIFVFSEKEEKYTKMISLILFFIILAVSFYISIDLYRQKATCDNYTNYKCVAKTALKHQDPAICDLVEKRGRSQARLCYRELSLWWEDASICEKIKIDEVTSYFRDYYDCIANIAENTNNPSLCEKIDYGGEYSPNKGHCYARFNN